MIHYASKGAGYILHERAGEYYGEGVGLLSVKTFYGGEAFYQVGRSRYRVDDEAYLVLNHGQSYAITIDAGTPLESFCIFFGADLAAEVRRSLTTPAGKLLAEPNLQAGGSSAFFERTYPHDTFLSPGVRQLRQSLNAQNCEPGWLAEQLYSLMQGLLQSHENIYRELERLPAVRATTREELYRRLYLAKEYAAATFDRPLTLEELAGIAGLSPNHLLRSFKQLFHQTPHQYLVALRLQQAQKLLQQTDDSITDICFAVGFQSLGSFSWLFRRRVGLSPSDYRRQNR